MLYPEFVAEIALNQFIGKCKIDQSSDRAKKRSDFIRVIVSRYGDNRANEIDQPAVGAREFFNPPTFPTEGRATALAERGAVEAAGGDGRATQGAAGNPTTVRHRCHDCKLKALEPGRLKFDTKGTDSTAEAASI